ncbi:MFS transporter [Subtercola sp. Z020]|uniref:MFS transporter n=1 Tax=Subtercola sp. Z020 TaxID=2080582 RepID=UPI000CE82F35|nr:MFS transporter [Subtercola sp. Z020]PPF89615.1 MFS transporter [Subtercola sp. Z020]
MPAGASAEGGTPAPEETLQGAPLQGAPQRLHRNIALLVAATLFMENLDGTILTTAAPSIGESFGVLSFEIGVAITAYLLTVAVLIPLSGWIAARFGTKQVFLAAIVVFTVASVLCAASGTLLELTASRVLQGVGGALMVPVGRLAVLRMTGRSDLVRTIALLTWPALIAPVLAPLAGGLLVTFASWHWIFLINVPLGVAAFVVAARILPVEPRVAAPPLDGVGALLTAAALAALVVLGSALASRGTEIAVIVALGGAAVVLCAWSIRHLARTKHPLLQAGMLRIETFRQSHGLGSIFRVTISAMPFLLPLLFQDAFGYSPVVAGALVLFVFVGNIAVKPFTTPLLRRFGFRTVLVSATSGAALSMVLCAFITRDTPLVVVALLLTFSGVARSVGFTAYNTIAFADIDAPAMSAANTLSSTLQQVAVGLGVAVGAVALRAGQVFADTTGAFSFSFVAMGALTLLAVVSAWRLSAGAGQNIRPAPRLPKAARR